MARSQKKRACIVSAPGDFGELRQLPTTDAEGRGPRARAMGRPKALGCSQSRGSAEHPRAKHSMTARQ